MMMEGKGREGAERGAEYVATGPGGRGRLTGNGLLGTPTGYWFSSPLPSREQE